MHTLGVSIFLLEFSSNRPIPQHALAIVVVSFSPIASNVSRFLETENTLGRVTSLQTDY